jgi:hypothetical protein
MIKKYDYVINVIVNELWLVWSVDWLGTTLFAPSRISISPWRRNVRQDGTVMTQENN